MNRAAAALARKRWAKRAIEKTCPFCGAVFRGDTVQTYCRPAHQNAAAVRRFRERHQGDTAARRPTIPSSPVDASLDLAHALAEADWARREGDRAEAARWERIAAALSPNVE
jgi:hypothetical protein